MHGALMLGLISAGEIWQGLLGWLWGTVVVLKVLIGFSLIIFVHELGHFLAARWMGVRVDRFAIGFFTRLCGWRRGEGFTFGPRPSYTAEQLAEKGYGETDYCINALPFGGYVKMLGEDDIQIDEKTGQMIPSTDPRAFTNKPVWRRMVVVSAGVIFNMLFAVLVYALVFVTVGKQVRSPVLGMVEPGGPAARAGLAPGDRVLKVDGDPVATFDDIIVGVLLAHDQATLTVQRDPNIPPHDVVLALPPTKDDVRGILSFRPAALSRIPPSANPQDQPEGLEPGDRITHVNGIAVKSDIEIEAAWLAGAPDTSELTVERHGQSFTLTKPKNLVIAPIEGGSDRDLRDNWHLLGFRPRQAARAVIRNDPAWRAGMREGDVVVRWNTIVNPTLGDILDAITAGDGKPAEVVVERDGREVTLTITPERPVQLMGRPRPRIGVEFGVDDRSPVVADVAPNTPASRLGIPRGARILAIGERPVANWFDIVAALRASAGESVAVRYRVGTDETTGRLAVPSSIVNELGLPPLARIVKIGGEDGFQLESGKVVSLPSLQAVRGLLQRNIGRTVDIEYQADPLNPAGGLESATFTVTAENADPWQMRISYTPPRMTLQLMTEPLIERNPAKALGLALSTTAMELYKVYRMIQSMVAMNVSLKHVSGPVGIFGVAYQEANAGIGDLLFFLAFLSVNLAVLNFLPMPVVDGGLMLFLILEKIRGKPVSIKVQVITTLTGLALIVLCFLLVTIQDITRLFGA